MEGLVRRGEREIVERIGDVLCGGERGVEQG